MSPDQVAAITGPLQGVCRHKRLSFDWRTYCEDGRWHADMRAGHPNGYGARPCWTGEGSDEATALERATAGAIYYWDDLAQTGISRTLLDLIHAEKK